MRRPVRFAVLALPLVFAAAAAPSVWQEVPASPTAADSLLVSTAWLADHLSDSGLVVLEVARDRAAYDAGHLPGARFVPVSSIVVTRDGLPNEVPSKAALDSLLSALGITGSSRIVIYGDPLWAARMFFTLDYAGLAGKAALLDGSREKWAAENRMLTADLPGGATVRYQARWQPERVVDAAWVKRHLHDRKVAILDARPPAQYTGSEAGDGVTRPGHIPGAENIFWQTTLDGKPPTLRSRTELDSLFRARGADAGDTVVTYCRTGVQASFLYFVSRYLGYPTRLYDGSYMDWSRRGDLPVEK